MKTAMTAEELYKETYEENIRLKSRLACLEEHPQTITQNQIINLNFPKAFGSEQITDILGKLPNLLHDAITKHTGRSVEYLTEQIHCNQKVFPEYTNVFIDRFKSPFAFVSNGEQFQTKPQKRIIEQIIDDSISMLQEYVDNNDEKCGQKIIEKYETYRDLVEDGDKKSQRRKDLEIEIAGMLLDMRPIIEARPHMKKMLDHLEEGTFTTGDTPVTPLGGDTP
jgi:DNA-directed RNA polymerase subunit N (RpoN/RPB10)